MTGIQLTHINKTYGKQQVLYDISLNVKAGEVIGLLGPNGAGKTTLMKILVGLIQADTPRAKEKTTEIIRPHRVGYLPEQNPLYLDMYVREYIEYMAALVGSNDTEHVLREVGLLPEAHKRIKYLSKGYRQRVGLAQALLGNPECLILDEPTTGLDPNQLDEIRSVIKAAGQSRTILLSTHILQEVREMCSRVVILHHGHIQCDKPMAEIDNLEELFRECTKEDNGC